MACGCAGVRVCLFFRQGVQRFHEKAKRVKRGSGHGPSVRPPFVESC